ncbi:organic cation transporter protein-like [Eriocheir sinensis]|uniref:organic cation transporter protein-like n=1 Tax=Eriocheir sinensis TaxID=95602 RepID=UPI0021C77BC7|nr:organic cation transporter protein-like [Eriocheir sinensis]XP_050688097.1 organic cation transporter protein-like [Eriocheir sinensis]
MSSQFGLDGVLAYLGNPHPCVTVQLLFTAGLMVLGLGSPEVFTLLPVPLYSCWHPLTPSDLGGPCEGKGLLPPTLADDMRDVLVCGEARWRPESFPGAVLAGLRVVVVVVAGLCLDALGRRRSVVAWMGLYFVVAFSRTFAPNAEAVVLCLTLEGAAAQASTLALLLLAAEGSTQSECVRSVCLVVLGHAAGVGAAAPLVHTFVGDHVYRQMARSLPSLVFVVFIMALPGSARWAVCRGYTQEAALTLKRSHHLTFDPAIKYKLTALYDEHKASMGQYGCAGHPLKESVMPLLRSGRMLLTTGLFLTLGLALGCAASARQVFHADPYVSFEDRQVAFGAFEFVSLLLLGLTVTRLGVRKVQVALMSALSLLIPLAYVLDKVAGVWVCGAMVFVSCLGHGCVVAAQVWMTVGVVRLTPTHSRGFVLGLTYGMATLGHFLPHFDVMGTFAKAGMYLDVYAEIGVWSIVTFVAGLLCLLLPRTPPSLPDTLAHIYVRKELQDEKPDPEEECENTQL